MVTPRDGSQVPSDLSERMVAAAHSRGQRAFRVLDRVVVGSTVTGDIAVMDRLVQATWWALVEQHDHVDRPVLIAGLSAEYQELTGALPDDADDTFARIVASLDGMGLLRAEPQ